MGFEQEETEVTEVFADGHHASGPPLRPVPKVGRVSPLPAVSVTATLREAYGLNHLVRASFRFDFGRPTHLAQDRRHPPFRTSRGFGIRRVAHGLLPRVETRGYYRPPHTGLAACAKTVPEEIGL